MSTSKPQNIPVTWEDQQKINRFGRLHTRMGEIEDELAGKAKEIDDIRDAVSEIENLLDDDSVKIKIGEIFFNVSNDEGLEMVKKIIEDKQAEYQKIVEEKEKHQEEIKELKTVLYAKFGSSIHLE